MTAISPETRRMMELARGADDPTPASEQAVRARLVAELGVSLLAGAAAAEAAGATGVVSGGASSAAVGSATKAASATVSVLVKTLVGLALATGLGAGAIGNGVIAGPAAQWRADVEIRVRHLAKRAWQVMSGRADEHETRRATLASLDRSVDPDAKRHLLLMEIARRPDHPVAKEAELVLILRAEEALAARDADRATQYLDAHQSHFADGALVERREALRAVVDRTRGADALVRRGGAPPNAPPATRAPTNF